MLMDTIHVSFNDLRKNQRNDNKTFLRKFNGLVKDGNLSGSKS